jgi:hypothetical protein
MKALAEAALKIDGRMAMGLRMGALNTGYAKLCGVIIEDREYDK